jgi:hypothetical protein
MICGRTSTPHAADDAVGQQILDQPPDPGLKTCFKPSIPA